MEERAQWNPPEFPRLRRDLKAKRPGEGESVYRIKAPESESVCLLYDMELSIARLMNGKRNLDAIVAAGKASGLPVDRKLLEKFIRELAAYHFIENAESPPSRGSTPPVPAEAAPSEPVSQPVSEVSGVVEAPPPPPRKSNSSLPAMAKAAANAAPKMFSALRHRPAQPDTNEHPWVEDLVETARYLPVDAFDKVYNLVNDAPRGFVLGGGIAGAVLIAGLILVVSTSGRPRGSFPCRLLPEAQLEIRARTTANLGKVQVSEGQRVHKGDVLLQQQDVVITAELHRVQQEIARLQVQLATGRMSPAVVAQERQALAVQEERARRLSAHLSALDITAPQDGVVTYVTASRRGQEVAENEVVAELASGDHLRAEVWLPERQSAVHIGNKLRFRPGQGSDQAIDGRVVGVGAPVLRAQGSQVRVEAEFVDGAGVLRPGMTGAVVF